jgi:heme/copper-type cytochrome/quinol oxidase subunit 2
LVAYPNKDKETHFEFTYWVGTTPPDMDSGNMGMIIGIVVAVIVIILILIAVMKIRKNKQDN